MLFLTVTYAILFLKYVCAENTGQIKAEPAKPTTLAKASTKAEISNYGDAHPIQSSGTD
jgi:hypothetical protein